MAGGRPLTLTSEKQEAILNAIRLGCSERTAASFGGVHLDTVRAWRRKGEKALLTPAGRRSQTERRYVEFVTLFDRALSECAVRMQQTIFGLATIDLEAKALVGPDGEIVRDAVGNPVIVETSPEARNLAFRAASYWLSHRMRDEYTTRQEVTGADGSPVAPSGTDVLALLRSAAAIRLEDPDEDDPDGSDD